jgi:hypothetical protein
MNDQCVMVAKKLHWMTVHHLRLLVLRSKIQRWSMPENKNLPGTDGHGQTSAAYTKRAFSGKTWGKLPASELHCASVIGATDIHQ